MAEEVYPVQEHSATGAHIQTIETYKAKHGESIKDIDAFWKQQAEDFITWEQKFHTVKHGSLKEGNLAWFLGGKLNASFQCLDRHVLNGNADKTAIIWEADSPGNSQKFTYKQVLEKVCQISNVLRQQGVKKGDAVTVYMPMVPEIAFVMLACARIGAPHSVVFAGFSAEALRDRIVDVRSKYIFTCDEGLRGGRKIALKKCVDDALNVSCDFVERVFVFKRTGNEVDMMETRDIWMQPLMDAQRPYAPAEPMDSEDVLFLLYTSGSTGKPKGVAHTTAGYMLYTMMTHKLVFDVRPDDVYACVADCGWITGHSYIVYGPLGNCATTVMFESTPLFPDPGRYWDLVQTHKVTQFYTAPTAIRALMRHGTEPIEKYDLSSLRILGSVGEPINPEAWKWYFENVGKSKCAIVDTYWQTETGGIIVTPLAGCTPLKPGSATLPFFGIELALLDPHSGKEIESKLGEETQGVLCVKQPWPSLTRTVHGNHERYMNTYLKPYPGFYFTGDGCTRDKDGYFWITGRVDDVLNVSGHRMGSAEIESALVSHATVAEAAVIGYPHSVKGQAICCYCITRNGVQETPELVTELRNTVRTVIGPFASPDLIVFTPGLPKTRSGKIMRRILRKIVEGVDKEQLGDISTLADQSVVDSLFEKVRAAKDAK